MPTMHAHGMLVRHNTRRDSRVVADILVDNYIEDQCALLARNIAAERLMTALYTAMSEVCFMAIWNS